MSGRTYVRPFVRSSVLPYDCPLFVPPIYPFVHRFPCLLFLCSVRSFIRPSVTKWNISGRWSVRSNSANSIEITFCFSCFLSRLSFTSNIRLRRKMAHFRFDDHFCFCYFSIQNVWSWWRLSRSSENFIYPTRQSKCHIWVYDLLMNHAKMV